MEIFNKIGDIASKTYKKTSKKTEKIAKEAKIKMKMNENKSKINDLYKEIGKIIYQKHINKEEVKIEEDLNSYCNQIDELSKENEKYQEEVLSIKNKRICENCYTEINLVSKYCPNCGFEQADERVKDIKPVQEDFKDEQQKDTKTAIEIVEEDNKE